MIFFASDVHLSSDTPAITARFLSFLERARREAQSVYLLGDIFESWVGDEDLGLKAYQPVFQALKETVQAGVAVYFMAGNRDFMVSDHVLAELLQSAHVVDGIVKGIPHPDWPPAPWGALHQLAMQLCRLCGVPGRG